MELRLLFVNTFLLVLSLDAVSAAPLRCLDPSECQTLGDIISSINTNYMSDDIMMTMEGFDMKKPPISSSRSRRKRRNTNTKDWPKSDDGFIYIPYVFSDRLTADRVRPNLEKAKENFRNHTCFRLIPRTFQTHYVDIKSDNGCWTFVGQVGGRQPMSLSSGCEFLDIILHEFMHVIGFYHEHQRVDRNEHIRVNYTNIAQQYRTQFSTMHGYTQGKDYDYTSVMHYGRKSGAVDKKYDSMTPIRSGTLGVPTGGTFSVGDIKSLNLKSMCGTDITVYSGVYAYKTTDINVPT